VPPDPLTVWPAPAGPVSAATTSEWATVTDAYHSARNVGPATIEATSPRTAGRSCGRPTSDVSWSARAVDRAACTGGWSMTGPAMATKRAVSNAVAVVHHATDARTSISALNKASAAASSRRISD
jgi:hypothetical protein